MPREVSCCPLGSIRTPDGTPVPSGLPCRPAHRERTECPRSRNRDLCDSVTTGAGVNVGVRALRLSCLGSGPHGPPRGTPTSSLVGCPNRRLPLIAVRRVVRAPFSEHRSPSVQDENGRSNHERI